MAGKGGGGAWKVAYADFVTAMMAFFLVMWICSQDQKFRQAVARYFQKDRTGNAANCEVITLEASDNIVFDEGGSSIALLGVNNLIVVRTRDAVLVCHRHHAEKIKNLVAKLPEKLQ